MKASIQEFFGLPIAPKNDPKEAYCHAMYMEYSINKSKENWHGITHMLD